MTTSIPIRITIEQIANALKQMGQIERQELQTLVPELQFSAPIYVKPTKKAEDASLADFAYEVRTDDWLTLAEKSFEFWDNEEDAYYDNL